MESQSYGIFLNYILYNITEFVICLGYKGYVIKEYFANYFLHSNDCTIDLRTNTFTYQKRSVEPWKISLVETGDDAMTGGRLLAVKQYVEDEICFTYGDGVCNINLDHLLSFHESHGKQATLTAVQPSGRYGSPQIENDDNLIQNFFEKPAGDGGWVNGGFFVLEPSIFELIESPMTIWEKEL